MDDDSKKTGRSYEEDLEELTKLVDGIGAEDCPLDSLEEMVKKAAYLIRTLRRRLTSTETTVREILDQLEEETKDRTSS